MRRPGAAHSVARRHQNWEIQLGSSKTRSLFQMAQLADTSALEERGGALQTQVQGTEVTNTTITFDNVLKKKRQIAKQTDNYRKKHDVIGCMQLLDWLDVILFKQPQKRKDSLKTTGFTRNIQLHQGLGYMIRSYIASSVVSMNFAMTQCASNLAFSTNKLKFTVWERLRVAKYVLGQAI
ncbi:hypothetical protein CLF_111713 [Clonorchis sinensis]|uniref:Uncharacterized protein n=1 Tax=Clonorchis sinensis TaxID=79923 RepID=G7YLX6_CLOSI|nr:hypothetical protein CLF_111713 [Clonorchis sinensis]